jgi:pimeloyl-ACP methyl ester carboxylesterase
VAAIPKVTGVSLLCALVFAAFPPRESHGEDVPPEDAGLGALVEAYFRSESAEDRSSLGEAIDRASGGDTAIVARAFEQISVWESLPRKAGTFSFDAGTGDPITVAYRVPEDYVPSRSYPMVLCLAAAGEASPDTIARAMATLGEASEGFVFVSPSMQVEHTFHQAVEATDDVDKLLYAARRKIRLDSDRAFLFGEARGGEAAWMTALNRPDAFAGVIVLSAYPRVPYPEQVYVFLLENLRRLPVLAVWQSPGEAGSTTRRQRVCAHSRAILQFAERASLPIVGVEVSPDAALKPPAKELRRMLARRRAAPSPVVSHWFRFPAHGRTQWLRQAKFKGDVWQGDQLSIAVSPTADRDRFIADVVRGKLAYFGGLIDGQEITLKTRRCARVDILMPAGLVDLTKPLLVRCNGRKRFDGVLEPSVQTMLEAAYANWDFQRPVAARLSLSIRSDAAPDGA